MAVTQIMLRRLRKADGWRIGAFIFILTMLSIFYFMDPDFTNVIIGIVTIFVVGLIIIIVNQIKRIREMR